MRTTLIFRGLSLVAALVVASGCYRYMPADMMATPAGTDIRVLVNGDGAEELRRVTELDPSMPRVNATMVALEGQEVVMNIPIARRQDGFVSGIIEQRVRLPTDAIVSFERKEINGTTTVIATVGTAVIIGGLFALLSQSLLGDSNGPQDPPDEFTLGLSFPWGR